MRAAKRATDGLRAAGVLLVLVLPARAQAPSRIDPLLTPLLQPAVQRSAAAAAQETGELPLRLRALGAFRAPDTSELRIHVFLWSDPAAEPALQALGARIRTSVGSYHTADLPLAALPAILRVAGLRYVEASLRSEPDLDVSAASVRATEVRERSGDDFVGLTGDRALVGIYDTGLDFIHSDFLDPRGRTRVRFLWDQTLSGTPPGRVGEQTFFYGHECDRASLDARTCPQRDTNGHGTHVAGIAAGDGSGTGGGLPAYRYVGIAPEAELLVVKGGDESFSEAGVVDGVAYIFARAAQLGLPAAVNLSLGSNFGAHDGTRLFERMIDSLSGPGRIVVKSAGNAGAHPNLVVGPRPRRIHGMGRPGAGDSIVLVLRVPTYEEAAGASNDIALVDLWYEGADSLTVRVVRPDGSSLTAPRGASAEDTAGAGVIEIEHASGGPSPLNGDVEVAIQIFDRNPARPPAAGDWRIIVLGRPQGAGAPFHAWLAFTTLGAAELVEGWSNSHLISSPGNARRAVTVGAFSTKLSWGARDGRTYGWAQQEARGDIATFSSPGPTRDGRAKPDIAAPGKGVMSALSSQMATPAIALTDGDGVHWILQGTSMSAPHVAGAVALMLQLDPLLDPERVKALLAAGAARDAFTAVSYATGDPGGQPNLTWGAGKLDVRGTVDLIPARPIVVVRPLTQPAGPSPVAGPPVAAVRFSVAAEGGGVRLEALEASTAEGNAAAHVDVVWLVADEDGDGLADAGEMRWGPATFGATGAILRFAEAPPAVSAGAARDFLLAAAMRRGAPRRQDFALGVTTIAASPLFGTGAASVSGLPVRGGRLELVPPEIRIAALTPADAPQPGTTVSSRLGRQLALAGVTARAGSVEGLRITALTLSISGRDPKAILRIFRDVDRDGAFSAADVLAAERTGALAADTNRIVLDSLDVPVPPGAETALLVVAELGGQAPNGTVIRAALEPAALRAVGLISGEEAERVDPPPAIAGPVVQLSLLSAGERYALSANPVRGGELIVNYRDRPRRIRILSLAGIVVAELEADALEAGRATWPLRNRDGEPVANGIYVLAIEFADTRALEKLMVLRRGGGP
ncbi:MAG: S8 family serine peptidase [Gemmatimonadetes bacterium]|nr:S8 family serine peptidase [Gemmatimonadota bacterium]